ncbi:hypothetical protein [Methylobacterium bullatum]|uniref:Uncharacterized protein n=1 Tax=Methylobacterium bullatum TaxID=570505 RepID=A0AAV4ZC32_9HYPH|nr:hypothetical protein [Methylobacterium bullatum]MBD8902761.1 hypothetical protein [Methylobacterium bullatum]GJD41333.1 hypothetical protein OICFNHDK_3816 [Methylobacterium bullatum]
MTRLLLTSKGEKTVCADRDDRGGVLLTGRDEQQVELMRGMILRLAVIALIPMWVVALFMNEVAA